MGEKFDQYMDTQELWSECQDLLETLQEIDYQLSNLENLDNSSLELLKDFIKQKLEQYDSLL